MEHNKELIFSSNSNYEGLYPFLQQASAPKIEDDILHTQEPLVKAVCEKCNELIQLPSSIIHLECSHSFHLKCMDLKDLIALKNNGYPFKCSNCFVSSKKVPILNEDLINKKVHKMYLQYKSQITQTTCLELAQKKSLIKQLNIKVTAIGNLLMDYSWFIENGVDFKMLIEASITFEQLHNVCKLKEVANLKALGFKKIYFKKHQDLYNIDDFCLYWKCSFKELASWFDITFKELLVLGPSSISLHILKLDCMSMITNYALTTKDLKYLKFGVGEWVCLLGLNPDVFQILDIHDSVVQNYFYFTKKEYLSCYNKFIM